MAVEEEGLRIFQSVKIKIGKKKEKTSPQSERLDGWLHVNGPSRQALRAGAWRAIGLLVVANVIQITRSPFSGRTLNRKQCCPKLIKRSKALWEIVGIWQLVYETSVEY